MTPRSPQSGIPPIIRKPPIAEELDKLREKPPRATNREPLSRLDPKYVHYSNRGNAYNDLGEPQRAIQGHDEAIRLDPKDAVAYSNRGHSYNELGEFQRAIQDFNEAILLDPQLAFAYNNRGADSWCSEPRTPVEDEVPTDRYSG